MVDEWLQVTAGLMVKFDVWESGRLSLIPTAVSCFLNDLSQLT